MERFDRMGYSTLANLSIAQSSESCTMKLLEIVLQGATIVIFTII